MEKDLRFSVSFCTGDGFLGLSNLVLGIDTTEGEVDFVPSSIVVVDQTCKPGVGANAAGLSRRKIRSTSKRF
jgi:hypothetical protein